MNEQDIKQNLLLVCKVAGSDSDFNVVAFHTLCNKLKQLGAKEERQEVVQAMENFLTELDQLPKTASIKFVITIVRQVAERFFEIIRARNTK